MQSDLLNLNGRIVVVSGAAGGGLNSVITRLVAEAGATVIGVSRGQDNLDKHLGPMIEEGLPVIPLAADVETEEGIAAVMDRATSTPGELFGLVCGVGGGPAQTWGPATSVSRENWQMLFSKNLESMFFLSQAFTAALQAQGGKGSIVGLSSITALSTQPYNIAYGAAKTAILSIVRTLALELAAREIRVNAVAPGAMKTPASLLPSVPELERKAIPMGRQASAEEVAATVLFLLSDMSSYVTGQCLAVDGGINLKWSHLQEDNTPLLVTNPDFIKLMKGEQE